MQRRRSLYLMRLGDKLPLAPLTELGPRTRVPGCVSVVHIHASTAADGTLRLAGAADSKLARGLVALLVRGLRGAPADAARQINVRAVAEAAGLPSLLTPGRLNGMEGMLKVVGTQLDEQQQEEEAAAAQELAEPPADSSSSSSSSVIQPAPQNPRLLWTAAEEEVALLLSGGVDSSVALHELLKAGHKVSAPSIYESGWRTSSSTPRKVNARGRRTGRIARPSASRRACRLSRSLFSTSTKSMLLDTL